MEKDENSQDNDGADAAIVLPSIGFEWQLRNVQPCLCFDII